MRVLLDTNVVLDVLLVRLAWHSEAAALWKANEEGRCVASITASSLTDIYYLARRVIGAPGARNAVRECLDRLTVLPVGALLADQALRLQVNDFEDALQIASAADHELDAIVTRDARGFANSLVPVLAPGDLLARLAAIEAQDQVGTDE